MVSISLLTSLVGYWLLSKVFRVVFGGELEIYLCGLKCYNTGDRVSMLELETNSDGNDKELAIRRLFKLAYLLLVTGFGLTLWTHDIVVRCKSAVGELAQAMDSQFSANCSDIILINNIGLALIAVSGLIIGKKWLE